MGPKNKENQKNPLITQAPKTGKGTNNIPYPELKEISGIKCFHTNADQLRNKQNEFELRIRDLKPNIPFSLEGYKTFSHNIENQEGRGIIIYIEHSLPAEKVNLNTSFKECLFVELKLTNKRQLLFGCIYRSDVGSDENNEELINMIKTTPQLNYSHIITVGDFNLNDINWTTKSKNPNNLNLLFVECLRDAFTSQNVTDPTRGRGSNNPNVLDLILSNDEDIIGDVDLKASAH